MAEESSSSFLSDILNGDISFETALTLVVVGVFVYYAYSLMFKTGKKFDPTSDFAGRFKLSAKKGETPVDDDQDNQNPDGTPMTILYATESGNAQAFAERIMRQARKLGFRTTFKNISNYPYEEKFFEETLVVMCLATYGEGDPTESAKEFYDWLTERPHDNVALARCNFAIFGLGSQLYEFFNNHAKKVDQRMAELGGNRLFELGLGDDSENIEVDFTKWSTRFWTFMVDHYKIDMASANMATVRMMTYTECAAGTAPVPQDTLQTGYSTVAYQPKLARVTENRELHHGGGRSCRHVVLDVAGLGITYEAGDHLGVYPVNETDLCLRYAARLGVDPATVFTLVPKNKSEKPAFPSPCTILYALQHFCDLAGQPSDAFINLLAEFAQNAAEKVELLRLVSPTHEENERLRSNSLTSMCNALDLMIAFSSINLPVDLFLEMIPRLQPRYYSIASSPKAHPTEIHACVAVVDGAEVGVPKFHGVASTFLRDLTPPVRVAAYVRRSIFKLPTNPACPIIMIGPGTGLAPFRGFIQDRAADRARGVPVGPTILYFGCRNHSHDYIYEEELRAAADAGSLTELHVAFSRDQGEKVYVQHLIERNAAAVYRLLQENARVYVCGDAKRMSRDVHTTFKRIFCEHGGMSEDDALARLKDMTKKGFYLTDVW